MDTLIRRIAGTGAAVLLIALGYVGFKAVSAPPAGSYTVTAELGSAGSGLNVGTDVKARGVRVGSIESIRYEDATAFATLRLFDEPNLPSPDRLELVVTAKTLLGEKQVELSFPDDAFGEEPFLAAGDTIVAGQQPTELQAAIEELRGFVESVDGKDLATIFEALSQQRGEGQRFGRNLELGQRLAAFGDRTAAANLANLRRLADLADALAPVADDFNRMNDNIPEATSLLPDRQAAVRRNLEALSSFAVGFAEFLEVEEQRIDTLLTTGDVIGAVFENQAGDVANLVDGLFKYFRELGRGGGFLTDGTEYAFFRILLSNEGFDPTALFPSEPGGDG